MLALHVTAAVVELGFAWGAGATFTDLGAANHGNCSTVDFLESYNIHVASTVAMIQVGCQLAPPAHSDAATLQLYTMQAAHSAEHRRLCLNN